MTRFKAAMSSMAEGGMPFADDMDEPPAWNPDMFDEPMEPMPEDTPGGIRRGDMVKVDGLQSAADLNGQIGIVVGFEIEKGRYLVMIPSRENPLGVKPDNLTVVADEDPPGYR